MADLNVSEQVGVVALLVFTAALVLGLAFCAIRFYGAWARAHEIGPR